MSTLLIENASEVLTLAGPARARVGDELADAAIVTDGAVFVRDGVIEAVGLASEVADRADADTVRIDASGMTVAPGFVDAHTHPVFAGWRAAEYELRVMGATYEEIAAAGGGIRNSVRRTRAASDDELAAIALSNARVFLAHGTTTIEAKSEIGRAHV